MNHCGGAHDPPPEALGRLRCFDASAVRDDAPASSRAASASASRKRHALATNASTKAFIEFGVKRDEPPSNKLHLVRDFVSDFLQAQCGCQIAEHRQRNKLTLAVLELLERLVSFGFYATKEELDAAAAKMQSRYRGRMARKEVELKKLEASAKAAGVELDVGDASKEELDAAASKMQAT